MRNIPLTTGGHEGLVISSTRRVANRGSLRGNRISGRPEGVLWRYETLETSRCESAVSLLMLVGTVSICGTPMTFVILQRPVGMLLEQQF